MIAAAWALMVLIGVPLLFLLALYVLRDKATDGMKRLACKMTWHSCPVGYETTGFDGASRHARCRWCGFEGLVDSQGGLF